MNIRSGIVAGLAAALAWAGAAALADETPDSVSDFGPVVGQPLGAEIEGVDQVGADRTFENLAGGAGLVVFFVRSADWCPHCQRQLIDINERVPEFHERGYGVAALSYDSTEDLARFAARRQITFSMISDPDSSVIDALGLRDPTVDEGHRRYGIPFPTTLVIDPERTVLAKFFNEGGLGENRGYRERVSLDDILIELDAIAEQLQTADAPSP